MAEDLSKLTCVELRKRLGDLGLETAGLKAALVQRLIDAQSSSSGQKRGREDEVVVEAVAATAPAPAPAPAVEAPASKRPTRQCTTAAAKEGAWQRVDSMLVLDPPELVADGEVLSFDMDDTLITTKSGRVFAVGRSDWQWLYPSVPAKLREAASKGKKLVIFTNQSGIDGKGGYDATKERMICGKIEDIIAELGVPVQVFVATTDDLYRKPATAMWDFMVARYNHGKKPDLTKSMFVGDAAGRAADTAKGRPKKDFSCSDRKFAHNVGVAFQTPQEFFLGEAPAEFDWQTYDLTKIPREGAVCNGGIESLTSSSQELVILCGFPASGKSTFAKTYLVPKGYFWVNRDTLKTPARCLSACANALAEGKSVVVDNTNPSKDARGEYIRLARNRGCPVRCFWMQVDEQLAQHLNYFRERITNGASPHVPRIGYAVFKKNWEEPEISEGFSEIKKIQFVANNFASEEAKSTFFQLA